MRLGRNFLLHVLCVVQMCYNGSALQTAKTRSALVPPAARLRDWFRSGVMWLMVASAGLVKTPMSSVLFSDSDRVWRSRIHCEKDCAPMSRRQAKQSVTLHCVHPNAAGLDLSLAEIWAPSQNDRAIPIRKFTFTPDLIALAEWLTSCRRHGRRGATGVLWIPSTTCWRKRGPVFLVNARHAKNVPGRKAMSNRQWISTRTVSVC